MKFKRLYVKLLISFLGILIITLGLILVLFISTAGKSFQSPLDKNPLVKLKIFQQAIQDRIDLHPDLELSRNRKLNRLVTEFSDIFGVAIWIESSEGRILVKPFPGPVKIPHKGFQRRVHHENGITLHYFIKRWKKYYATIPLQRNGEDLRMHLYYDTKDPDHIEGIFFLGLLLTGAVVALLIIPLAGIITRRINQLNRSALEFAAGNLSCRTSISGKDEIAKLGSSFNFMADKLETLIQNNKELTANVSHELRSPLARIRVSKELILDKLEKQGRGEDILRYFTNMETDIRDLDTLVDHMLKLSKLDYQESALAPEDFDFIQFLKRELKAYRPLIGQNLLTLELQTQDFLPVKQDKSILKSILSNLLDNAIKYTGKKGKIRIKTLPAAGNGLAFTVANTCTPLEEKELELIFNPFYRRRGDIGPGSGLGLAIARKQAGRCRGKISVENTDQGLSFMVNLP